MRKAHFCRCWGLLIIGLAGLSTPAAAQTIRTETITPQATDPNIRQWNAAHYVLLDTSAAPRNKLFVFMHGLMGAAGGATELLETAASERYHTVGITYPNDWVPFSFCNDGSDPNCYENLRLEIIDGVDRSPHVAVDRTNSLENRLIKLIQHIDGQHPAENWGQFLSGGLPDWGKIVVWGHSQGGTNAAVIAKHHALARLVMTGAPTDSVPGGFAGWWTTHATPSDVYFGFCHTQDQLSTKVSVWGILGMHSFGGVQDVATVPAPYNASHELSSSVAPAISGQFHNSVSMDAATPRDGQGEPVYRPVWRYLMSPTSEALVADMNCDGAVNLQDVEPFVLALIDSTAYQAAFPSCDVDRADINGDGLRDSFDVRGLLSIFVAGH